MCATLQFSPGAADTRVTMLGRSVEQLANEVAVTHRVRRELAGLTGTPPQFTAFLDVLFDIETRRTEPAFADLIAHGDLVFARGEGRTDFEYYIGHRSVLERRLRDIAQFLEFGKVERDLMLGRLYDIADADAPQREPSAA